MNNRNKNYLPPILSALTHHQHNYAYFVLAPFRTAAMQICHFPPSKQPLYGQNGQYCWRQFSLYSHSYRLYLRTIHFTTLNQAELASTRCLMSLPFVSIHQDLPSTQTLSSLANAKRQNAWPAIADQIPPGEASCLHAPKKQNIVSNKKIAAQKTTPHLEPAGARGPFPEHACGWGRTNQRLLRSTLFEDWPQSSCEVTHGDAGFPLFSCSGTK